MKKLKHTELVNMFTESREFENLSPSTKKQYVYQLGIIQRWLPKNIMCKDISGAIANDVIDAVDKNMGSVLANRVMAVCRRMYSFAIRRDLLEVNPWRKVTSRPEERRSVIWTPEEVTMFLNEAYSRWDTYAVGLIAQMCYEWCQRVGDIRLLEWTNISFEEGTVELVQSKRRAHVKIPISDELLDMLKEQWSRVGMCKYVAPNVKDMAPFNEFTISRWALQIKERAGVPEHLRLSDLRRTGTTEMAEAGAPMPQMMAVTGHSNPASIMPYLKNSLTSSREACSLRHAHKAGDT